MRFCVFAYMQIMQVLWVRHVGPFVQPSLGGWFLGLDDPAGLIPSQNIVSGLLRTTADSIFPVISSSAQSFFYGFVRKNAWSIPAFCVLRHLFTRGVLLFIINESYVLKLYKTLQTIKSAFLKNSWLHVYFSLLSALRIFIKWKFNFFHGLLAAQ